MIFINVVQFYKYINSIDCKKKSRNNEYTLSYPLKYTKTEPDANNYSNELATIKFRYKKPDGEKSIEMVQVIENKSVALEKASNDMKFSSAVAWFGLKLRDSKLIADKSSDEIVKLAKQGNSNDGEGYKAEFIRLVEGAKQYN